VCTFCQNGENKKRVQNETKKVQNKTKKERKIKNKERREKTKQLRTKFSHAKIGIRRYDIQHNDTLHNG